MADITPQEFGKYVLLSRLASGGMAVTYRARLTGAAGVTKPCVIKQILPYLADDPDFVAMFIREARVAAGLSHGNIAQVFDFGEVDGQYFIAMELVHGQPLSKVLRRAAQVGLGCFPTPLALHIISKVCDGLDYAHRHVGEDGQPLGLVHRDVSPDNVLISYEGEVKVIDFGIAKATSVVEMKTSPGTVKGKYPYFSPEQAEALEDLDTRTDVYSAGVVLYEMVCGRRPYEGELLSVVPRILAGDYAPPSTMNPAIGPELESIIVTAMARDREARFPTAQALSEALVELLYRDTPRFTPTLLSQLMSHLFAEELTAEGRKVEVTPAFQEQLAAWSNGDIRSSGGARGSSPNVRRISNPNARRVTGSELHVAPSNGRRTSTAERERLEPLPSDTPLAPELPPEPDTDADLGPDDDTRLSLPPLVAPEDIPLDSEDSTHPELRPAPTPGQDAPVELSAVTVPTQAAALRTALREARAKKQAAPAARWQRRLRTISLVFFGLIGLIVLFHLLRRNDEAASPTTTIWITSEPAGASVRLNGESVRGVTPLLVDGVLLEAANTLVLTLPGHLPWTKHFTPSGGIEPQVHAELQQATLDLAPPQPLPVAATPEVDVTPEEPEDTGTEVVDAGVADEESPSFHEVVYPTRLMVLSPAHNAVPLREYETARIDLNPATGYSVWTEGRAAVAEGNATASGTLAYFVEGNGPADSAFGLLSRSPRTIKGARRLHVFAIDETGPEDNRGIIRIHLRQARKSPPRSFTFDAQKHALQLRPEHQLVLRGLNPQATYLLTVRDDVAELRPGANGRVRQVLCVERGPDPSTSRYTYRLFESGKRYQLTGLETLRCTFPDTRLEDNAGALEVDIADVTNMTRKQRAQALRAPH